MSYALGNGKALDTNNLEAFHDFYFLLNKSYTFHVGMNNHSDRYKGKSDPPSFPLHTTLPNLSNPYPQR
jgi:hypothetical protein